jgi:hypothetical protein
VKKFEGGKTILSGTSQANREFIKLLPTWSFGGGDLEVVSPGIRATNQFRNRLCYQTIMLACNDA